MKRRGKVHHLIAVSPTATPPIFSVPMPVGPSLSVWTKPNRGWKHRRLIAKLKANYGDVRPTLSDRMIAEQLVNDPDVKRWGSAAAPSERAVNRAGNELWGSR
jgi:hypothetical protein